MAPVRCHESLPLRTASAFLIGMALFAARSMAQGGPPPSAEAPRIGAIQDLAPPAPAPPPTAAAPPERVVDIKIIGNNTITREKVLANIGTRVGNLFDQQTYEKDVRKLSTKNWFVHVQPRSERVPGGVLVTFEVVERPVLQYVRFEGNKKIKSHKTLEKEAGLKKGDSLDPYSVQDGARKLESFYQTKGFNHVKITILEGTKPGDRGAIYLINEGTIQKFSKVTFEGNSYSFAPDGRLKSLIQSKPPLFWLFKGQVDPKKMAEDVEKLKEYYRSFGYFGAKVGYDYKLNDKEDRMTLVFHISEGPRYKVGNISFIGNAVYPEDVLVTDRKLSPGAYFDQHKMNSDIGTMKDLYGSNGYVFSEVTPELKFDLEPGRLDVVYQVSEGNQYRVGEISIVIKGDNPHTRFSTVMNRLSTHPGDIADVRAFRASERRIKASALFNNDPSKGDTPKIVFSPPDSEDGGAGGKKRATAKRTGNPDSFRGQSPDNRPAVEGAAPPAAGWPSTNPPPSAPSQILPLPPASSDRPIVRSQSPDGGYGQYGGRGVNPISPGPQPYSVNQPPPSGAPNVLPPPSGAPYVPPGGAVAPGGQPPYVAPGYASPPAYSSPPGYSNPPLFPSPGSVLQPPMLPQPSIPVEVVVNEAQTGKFTFGAGVNSNAGLVGSIVIDEQNFDITRLPTSWEDFRTGRAFRGAGQKFRLEAAPGTQVSRYLFNFAEPYLFDTPVSYGLSGYYFNRFYRDWTEQRAGGRTSLGYQLTPDLSGSIALRAEDIRISQPRVLTVPDLNQVLGHTQLYSVKPQLAYDSRDSTFLPTQGTFVSTDFEYVFGTFQFPRFTINFQKHMLLRERPDGTGRHTLSYYTQFGIAGNDIPIYERFYAGGFGTLRGFQFRGASPMIDTVEVGGKLMNVNSIEYMFPITADDMLKGVAFVDYGTVEYNRTFSWQNYRVAPGLGLRVTIPMISAAPIALDFAVPVHDAPTDLKQVFSFFVGVGH
jgi:outer membrane protein insertion porin family